MVDTYLHNTTTNKIIIPWSGGVDSTNILFKVLEYLENNEEIFNNIEGVYLLSAKSELDQGVIESKAKNKIIKFINKKHKKIKDKLFYEEFDHSFSGRDFRVGDLPQPYWWITKVFSHYGSNFTLLLGYHRGDDFWMIFDKFSKLVDVSMDYFENQNNRYIYYPLAYNYKDDIYNELPNKVKKMISFCELPIGNKPCKKCGSCKTHYKFIKE